MLTATRGTGSLLGMSSWQAARTPEDALAHCTSGNTKWTQWVLKRAHKDGGKSDGG